MDDETLVFGALTLGIVIGTAILLVGVELDNQVGIGAGSAIMVLAILGMAGYVAALEEPAGDDQGH